MKKKSILSAIVAAWLLVCSLANAAEPTKAPQIAYSTKFRNVDYLFTEQVEKAAKEDGASYDYAIREVGWELISAVGRACNAVDGIQAILIDRINFKGKSSFVVLGVIASNKFLSLNFNGAPSNEALAKLFAAFEKERVVVTRRAETSGVELAVVSP